MYLYLEATEAQVLLSSSTNEKIYVVVKNNIVCKIWCASSLEEAQKDNPNAIVIEVTKKNSPWYMYEKYNERK